VAEAGFAVAAPGGVGSIAGSRIVAVLAGLALATLCGARGTQDAVANGDTRTLEIVHEHTKESASITFKRNGYYDQAALRQLNWMLRDWRTDEPIRMEPRLFDIVWEVYREVGASEPIRVVSAYRSPGTNAMLRRRSRAVAENSQHMAGRAMDFYLPGVSMSRVREIGMRLQDGGVGFYPNAFNPFVHLDAGSVRSWPRMSRDQLARLFPDGRTVHLPRDGKPLEGYEVAKADILQRGGSVAGLTYAEAGGDEGGGRKSLWATLFGGGDDEDSDFYRSPTSRTRGAPPPSTRTASAAPPTASGSSEDGGMRAFLSPVPDPGTAPAVTQPGGRTRLAARSAPEQVPTEPLRGSAAPAPGFEERPAAAVQAPQPPTRPAEAASDPAPTRVELARAAASPLPPSRPDELMAVASVLQVPLPPARLNAGGAALASLGAAAAAAPVELTGQMRIPAARGRGITAPAAYDERAALRALFDTAASDTLPSRRADISTSRSRPEPVTDLPLDEPGPKVRMQFTAASPEVIRSDAFRGEAIARLPTLR
jgi:uncharacterized protein YcbK (DUF882 family)